MTTKITQKRKLVSTVTNTHTNTYRGVHAYRPPPHAHTHARGHAECFERTVALDVYKFAADTCRELQVLALHFNLRLHKMLFPENSFQQKNNFTEFNFIHFFIGHSVTLLNFQTGYL